MTERAADPPPVGPFLWRYGLAWAGGNVAYIPILTLLVPMRFTVLAGAHDVEWLARTATAGAISASLAAILWGWLSDRLGRRLGLSAVGLVLFTVATIGLGLMTTPAALFAAIIVWQVALNLYLAPLLACAADRVPNKSKGALGGFLAFAPAIAAVSIGVVSLIGHSFLMQLGGVVVMVVAAAIPLLAKRRSLPPRLCHDGEPERRHRATIFQLWSARLVVQIAEGLIFVFLYYFLRDLSGGSLTLGRYAIANALAQGLSIPVALSVGFYSDRSGKRRAPLLAMIAILAAGLALMAVATSFWLAVAAYALFLVGSNSFLALHAAFTMQHLPDPRHYGRDLGLMNLTNTLPAVTTPLLALGLISWGGYPALLGVLAVVMTVPALIVGRLKIA